MLRVLPRGIVVTIKERRSQRGVGGLFEARVERRSRGPSLLFRVLRPLARSKPQATVEGGFASKENLERVKQLGVSDGVLRQAARLAQRIQYLPNKTSLTRVLSPASPRLSAHRTAVSTSLRRRKWLDAQARRWLG